MAELQFRKPKICTKIQVITVAKFRRPSKPPTRCNVHRYHVWTWESFEDEPDLSTPPKGSKCQCGCLTE